MKQVTPTHLADWYARYGPAMVLYTRQWLDAAEAEDVVHEVFAQLMQQRRPPDAIRPWLYRVARHKALNVARSRRRRAQREHEAQLLRPAPPDGTAAEVRFDARTAERGLAALPDEQREVIVLRIWGGLAWQEIADALDSPVSTVFSRYRSGLTTLRQRLESPCTNRD